MAKIKINDLPKDYKLDPEQMKRVKGQGPITSIGYLSNPWALGEIIATAIAVPVAISSEDDDAS